MVRSAAGSVRMIGLTVSMLATAAIVGCNSGSSKPTTSSRNDVLDIRPIEPASSSYQPPLTDNSSTIPVAAQPMTTEAPLAPAPMLAAATDMPVTTIARTAPVAAKHTHVVQAGETLFSIARTTYGNGKAWRKIASANPGLTPAKLKVGQKLILP